MKKVSIDVMILGGVKYYDTLTFLWNEKKPLTEEWIHEYVISKRPTLKYQPFTLLFN